MKSAFIQKDGTRVLVENEGTKVIVSVCDRDFNPVAKIENVPPMPYAEIKYHKGIRKQNQRKGITFVAKHSTTI